MSEYIRTNKFDTNECPNIFVKEKLIRTNVRIYIRDQYIRIFEYIRHTLHQTLKNHTGWMSIKITPKVWPVGDLMEWRMDRWECLLSVCLLAVYTHLCRPCVREPISKDDLTVRNVFACRSLGSLFSGVVSLLCWHIYTAAFYGWWGKKWKSDWWIIDLANLAFVTVWRRCDEISIWGGSNQKREKWNID